MQTWSRELRDLSTAAQASFLLAVVSYNRQRKERQQKEPN